MKVVELLKIGGELLKLMSQNDVMRDDYRYVGLYEEYQMMRDNGMKHAVEHISSYYGVDPKSETAAYLQGEIARNLFPAVAMAVCPRCHNEK